MESPKRGRIREPNQLDPLGWLERHGDVLYRYACQRLGDSSAAEDAVQEALLAAFEARESFAGQSSERTWLIAILKRKVVDRIRQAVRDRARGLIDSPLDAETSEFEESGLWREGPQRWRFDAADNLKQRELREALRKCMSKLPGPMLGAFCMRELDRLDAEEICKLLDVTPTNLWTLLHRARTRLRLCLERNWFGAGPEDRS